VLLLLTIALVLVGAVSLIIGFIQDSLLPIYISIGCSVLAAAVLIAFSRISRREVGRVVTLPASPGAVPAASGGTFAGVSQAAAPATSVVGGRATVAEEEPTESIRVLTRVPHEVEEEEEEELGGPELFPIADYDDLRVSEIVPLLAELDPDELEEVRQAEKAGKSRSTILDRIDQLTGAAPAASSRRSPAKAASTKVASTKVASKAATTAAKAPAKAGSAAKASKTAAKAGASSTAKTSAKSTKSSAKSAGSKSAASKAGSKSVGSKSAAKASPSKPSKSAAKSASKTSKAPNRRTS